LGFCRPPHHPKPHPPEGQRGIERRGGGEPKELEADALIADKAFDADARVLEPLAAAGKTAVIPPRANRSSPRDYDRELYAARHLIENLFAKIKQFRAIATRYEKTRRNFLAAVQLVASVVWLN
jgi:transposase